MHVRKFIHVPCALKELSHVPTLGAGCPCSCELWPRASFSALTCFTCSSCEEPSRCDCWCGSGWRPSQNPFCPTSLDLTLRGVWRSRRRAGRLDGLGGSQGGQHMSRAPAGGGGELPCDLDLAGEVKLGLSSAENRGGLNTDVNPFPHPCASPRLEELPDLPDVFPFFRFY